MDYQPTEPREVKTITCPHCEGFGEIEDPGTELDGPDTWKEAEGIA